MEPFLKGMDKGFTITIIWVFPFFLFLLSLIEASILIKTINIITFYLFLIGMQSKGLIKYG